MNFGGRRHSIRNNHLHSSFMAAWAFSFFPKVLSEHATLLISDRSLQCQCLFAVNNRNILGQKQTNEKPPSNTATTLKLILLKAHAFIGQ